MELSLYRGAKDAVNGALSLVGLKVMRARSHDWADLANFLPLKPTLEAARDAGLSVGDYIDTVINNSPGATQDTMDRMADLGVFAGPVDTIVEIGPGSGRYLEKTLNSCAPTRYEIYETAGAWAAHLVETFEVRLNPTDGKSLSASASDSIDLVQAHKVFPSTPFLVTANYWLEMARVVRPGGHAVFDIVTEACLDPDAVARWAADCTTISTFPAVMPRKVATDFFESRGFSLSGSFLVPMTLGQTETYVFKKVPTRN